MKRIAIIGAGRFGATLAESLVRKGAEVIILERDREIVQRMASLVARAVTGDGTDERVLTEAGVSDCDTAVVAIGNNMEGSILATVLLKERKVPRVVAKAVTDTHGKVLQRVGADLVVYPDRERAQRLARSLLADSVLDYFEISSGFSVVEMEAPSMLTGKTLVEAEVRRKYGITVLAIKREKKEGEVVIAPTGDDIVQPGDALILFGPDKKLDDLSRQE